MQSAKCEVHVFLEISAPGTAKNSSAEGGTSGVRLDQLSQELIFSVLIRHRWAGAMFGLSPFGPSRAVHAAEYCKVLSRCREAQARGLASGIERE